jgi:hypothetical protein
MVSNSVNFAAIILQLSAWLVGSEVLTEVCSPLRVNDVSREHMAIFMVAEWSKKVKIWRWKRHVPAKRRLTFNGLHSVRVRVRVTLQLTVSQSVRLGVEPDLGLLTRDNFFFFFWKVTVLSFGGALSDERSGLDYIAYLNYDIHIRSRLSNPNDLESCTARQLSTDSCCQATKRCFQW